jgi:hypothetical protein
MREQTTYQRWDVHWIGEGKITGSVIFTQYSTSMGNFSAGTGGTHLGPLVVCCSCWGKACRSLAPSLTREVKRWGVIHNTGDTLVVNYSSLSIFQLMYVHLFDIYYYPLFYYQALLSPPARERVIPLPGERDSRFCRNRNIRKTLHGFLPVRLNYTSQLCRLQIQYVDRSPSLCEP